MPKEKKAKKARSIEMTQHRVVAWTLHHYDDELIKKLLSEVPEPDIEKKSIYDFVAFQEEKGEETGRLHLQGMFYSRKKNMTWSNLKNKFTDKLHFEARRDQKEDAKQAYMYVCKPNIYHPTDTTWVGNECQGGHTDRRWEAGKKPFQGGRSDIGVMCTGIVTGKLQSAEEVMKAHPSTYLRCYKGVEKMLEMINKPKTYVFDEDEHKKVNLYWFFGPPGCGKSKKARQFAGSLNTTVHFQDPAMKEWFEKYNGEKTIFFDDMDTSKLNLKNFLRMTDEYERPLVQIKGSSTRLDIDTVIVTTVEAPWEDEIFLNMKGGVNQVIRRMTEALRCWKDGHIDDKRPELYHYEVAKLEYKPERQFGRTRPL